MNRRYLCRSNLIGPLIVGFIDIFSLQNARISSNIFTVPLLDSDSTSGIFFKKEMLYNKISTFPVVTGKILQQKLQLYEFIISMIEVSITEKYFDEVNKITCSLLH